MAGTYKADDGATFSITSTQQDDGTAIFGYDRYSTWIADGKDRDSHTGTLNPQQCPSQIVCKDKVLIVKY